MSQLSDLRSILTARVFNDSLGSTVTITPQSTAASADGGFTPGTTSDGTAVTVKGIPYSNTTSKLFRSIVGEVKLGEGAALVPYDTSVSVGDKAAWLGKTYHVDSVEDVPLGNGVAVRLIIALQRN